MSPFHEQLKRMALRHEIVLPDRLRWHDTGFLEQGSKKPFQNSSLKPFHVRALLRASASRCDASSRAARAPVPGSRRPKGGGAEFGLCPSLMTGNDQRVLSFFGLAREDRAGPHPRGAHAGRELEWSPCDQSEGFLSCFLWGSLLFGAFRNDQISHRTRHAF